MGQSSAQVSLHISAGKSDGCFVSIQKSAKRGNEEMSSWSAPSNNASIVQQDPASLFFFPTQADAAQLNFQPPQKQFGPPPQNPPPTCPRSPPLPPRLTPLQF